MAASSGSLSLLQSLWPAGSAISPPVVPPLLLKGEKFDIWTDDSGQTIEMDALLRVDESGLFIYWKSPGKEPVIIDCMQISDIRQGSSPKDPQLAWDLELKGSGSLNYRTLCICVGFDFVSLNYIYVAAYDDTKAKQWTDALRKIVHSPWLYMMAHASPMWQLHKLWIKLRLSTDASGRLLAKTVSKSLGSQASTTGDKPICEAMQEMGMLLSMPPQQSVSSMPSVSSSSVSSIASPLPTLVPASAQASFQYSASSSVSNYLSASVASTTGLTSPSAIVNSPSSAALNNTAGASSSASFQSQIEECAVDFEAFSFDRFFSLFRRFCPRPEIEALFLSLCGKDDITIASSAPLSYTSPPALSKCSCPMNQLKMFLNKYQRDPRHNEILHPFYNNTQCKQILEMYETDEMVKNRGHISYDGFLRYILSESDPIDISMLNATQDMDQPLTHYYISTSHNTYLIGRQFGGKSSVEMYRQVLISGCRSVELDCWDGNNGEPIITHGKAMCTDILYRDALLAIKETAFLTSPYPLTLSFENHCSQQQQYKLAKYAEEIFGEMLLKEPLPTHPLRAGIPLPSPNQLKYKILIKNKRLRPEVEQKQLELFHKGLLKADDNSADVDELGGVADGDVTEPALTRTAVAASASLNVGVKEANVNGCKSETLSKSSSATPGQPAKPTFSEQRKSVGVKTVINSSSAVVNGDDAALLELPSDMSSESSSLPVVAAAVELFNDVTKGRNSPGSNLTAPSSKSTSVTSAITSAAKAVMNSSRKNAITGLSPAEEAALLANYQYRGATANVHPYLSSMINYTQPIKFQGFDVAEGRNIHHHMSSFNENAGLALLKEQAIEFVNYNKRQFSRIYPKGSRYDSSNFNPQVFWSAGCQMVALNFQTLDLAMQLNQGRFEYNGRSGILLKPEFLRRADKNNFNPFSEAPVDGVIAATCTVQILSAQFLSSDRRCGSYVEVDMYGLPADTIRKEFKTRLVPSNGFNPVYVPAVNGDPLPGAYVFRKVVLPDLAVLRFAVFDETGRVLGQRILPLDGLQAGYRHISLRSEGSVPLPMATIFCRIILDTYVPEGVGNFVNLLADPQALEKLAERRHIHIKNLPQRFASSADQETLTGNGMTAESGSSSPRDTTISPTPRKATPAQLPNPSEQPSDTLLRVEQLQNESKSYLKLIQKQQKELQRLKKRQNSEKLDLANKHYKSLPGNNKESPLLRKIRPSASGDMLRVRSASAIGGPGRCIASTTVVSQLVESSASAATSQALEIQAHEYAELMQKCLRDERDVQLKHAEARIAMAKSLLAAYQEQQLRERFQRHEREFKDLELQQARQMKESVSQIADDKSVSRQEKDRKTRELKESNIKRFYEERKRLVLGHERQREQLVRFHSTQMELLDAKLKEEIAQIESAYEEERLGATRPQYVV